MLKDRVITAAVLLACLFTGFYFCSPLQLAILFAIIFSFGAWEWANIAGLTKGYKKLLFTICICGCLLLAGQLLGLPSSVDSSLVMPIVKSAFIWWLLCVVLVKTYPESSFLWRIVAIRLLMGLFVLVPSWISLVYLLFSPKGPVLLLLVLFIVALADTGAYFSGKKFGKHKLAFEVSPGKTWEGVVGGLLIIGVFFVVLMFCLKIQFVQWTWFTALLFLPALFSVVGDLFESMLKRTRGIKDSGRLLPGHGGVLDRIDGLVAALPVFVLVLLVSGIEF